MIVKLDGIKQKFELKTKKKLKKNTIIIDGMYGLGLGLGASS